MIDLTKLPHRLGDTFVPGNDDWMEHPDPMRAERGDGHPDFVVQLPFVRFDTGTGEITSTGMMARAHILRERLETGGTIIGSGHYATHHVDLATRTVREKTACPARLDGMTLRGLPMPCRIEISNPSGEPSVYPNDEAAELDLAFDHPGTYAVRVLSVPHRPGAFTVVAT